MSCAVVFDNSSITRCFYSLCVHSLLNSDAKGFCAFRRRQTKRESRLDGRVKAFSQNCKQAEGYAAFSLVQVFRRLRRQIHPLFAWICSQHFGSAVGDRKEPAQFEKKKFSLCSPNEASETA